MHRWFPTWLSTMACRSSTIGSGALPPPGMAPLSLLVNCSSGFIGTRVIRHLHATGHRVTGLDHIPPKDLLPEGVAFHICDIRQEELPDRTFGAVVHPAALAGVRQSMDRPPGYENTSVAGTRHDQSAGVSTTRRSPSGLIGNRRTKYPAGFLVKADPMPILALEVICHDSDEIPRPPRSGHRPFQRLSQGGKFLA